MWRFTERTVRSGLVMAWRLATSPVSTSPVFENATTEGVVRDPSALGMTTGSPASNTETTEFVVPRSIPTARDICRAICGDWGLGTLRTRGASPLGTEGGGMLGGDARPDGDPRRDGAARGRADGPPRQAAGRARATGAACPQDRRPRDPRGQGR